MSTRSPIDDDFDLRDLAGGSDGGDDLLVGLGVADSDDLNPIDSTMPTTGPDIIAELGKAFDRAVRDPSQSSSQAVWQAMPEAVGNPAPTLAQWQREAQAHGSLHDILLRGPDIHALMDAFGPPAGAKVLEPEAFEDVLHLFAGDLPRATRRAIPDPIRAEHHMVALDSHIDLTDLRATPAQDP